MVLAVLGLAPDAALAQPRALVHYQKNMLYSLSAEDERRLAGDIIARAPDTVSMQEVNRDNREILALLRPAYPSQKLCRFNEIGGVAVLSRWPMVPGSAKCLKGRGIAALQIEMPEGRVWVMSVHLETPERPLHGEMVRALAPELGGFDGAKIMGGDFNAFPGSTSVTALALAAGVAPLGPKVVTKRLGGLFGLTIDHVLVTGGDGRVEQLPLIGSDHYGLLARFVLDL
ncbi:MAG: endonuclease/exonuclease/phosphatase family protein [Maritimibacter sp.]|nr:endonuclease/exonuclease/phosphatase family protein [Maritimibacter sp.]